MRLSRRRFIGHSAAIALGFGGLRSLARAGLLQDGPPSGRFGELVPDPENVLDLPEGFGYQIFSRTGDRMDDGFRVPGAHDGMAAFSGPGGRTVLVRNHELTPNAAAGPFGQGDSGIPKPDVALFYDPAGCVGGTTTLVYDTRQRVLEGHFLSLTGTIRNCAGGPTPWNSWVTCEEAVDRAGNDGLLKDHGFNFEVPSTATGLVEPVPLVGMGRFNHEAIAVDAASGVVYQTEDRADSLFYRYLPSQPGQLWRGGRLQALVILGREGVDTSNRRASVIEVGEPLEVTWVDLTDVVSPGDDLRVQGARKGAATFSRGEGVWSGSDGIYFAATSGGANSAGQIWRYRPSASEGRPAEARDRGVLELFVEPNDVDFLDNADNLTVAPWGDLIVCEDGPGGNFVRGITPEGRLYNLARNALNTSEFAGATFSPDGTTLFVNIQRPGLTVAIGGVDGHAFPLI